MTLDISIIVIIFWVSIPELWYLRDIHPFTYIDVDVEFKHCIMISFQVVIFYSVYFTHKSVAFGIQSHPNFFVFLHITMGLFWHFIILLYSMVNEMTSCYGHRILFERSVFCVLTRQVAYGTVSTLNDVTTCKVKSIDHRKYVTTTTNHSDLIKWRVNVSIKVIRIPQPCIIITNQE